MQELYLRRFGTDRKNGNSTFEWVTDETSAAVYDKAQAKTDCDFLNRHTYKFNPITPEGDREKLVFENFRIVEMADGRLVIVFESRTEAEKLLSGERT